MKKLHALTISMLLSMPMILISSQDSKSSQFNSIKKDLSDKMSVIKDKQSQADFSNDELEKKKNALQDEIGDLVIKIQSKSSTLTTNLTDEQKAQKANTQDALTYLKTQLTGMQTQRQAQMAYIQAQITSVNNTLAALKNRNLELQTKKNSGKDGFTTMTASRLANIQDQATAITGDIQNATDRLTQLTKYLQQVKDSSDQANKILNSIRS